MKMSLRILEVDRIGTDRVGDSAWRVSFFSATTVLTPQELGRALAAVVEHLVLAYGHAEADIVGEMIDLLVNKDEASAHQIENIKLTEQREGISLGKSADIFMGEQWER